MPVATRRNSDPGQSTRRRCSGRTLTNFCNTHGYARDPPDDGDVARIANPPSMSTGMRSRNQYQLVAIQFTPTADVAITKFEEKDRAVKVVMPIYKRDGSSEPALLRSSGNSSPLSLRISAKRSFRYACAVGRMTIWFTSTSAGCSMAKAIARAIAAGEIAIFSIRSTIWALTPGSLMEVVRFVCTNPGEMPVTRSLAPASCRKVSVMVRTAFFVPA